jgi:beta-lactamase regulating signal transducer with metallopeptidase domain
MSVWIAETLLATALLMALVMLLRRPVTHFLGAGAAYMLWALPLARLVLPPMPRDVATVTPLQNAVDQSGLVSALTLPTTPTTATASAASLPWVEIAASVWMAGAAAFLLFHAVAYIRFRRLMLTDALPLGREGRVRIIVSPRATGPLAFGVLHPYVALPLDFDTRFDADERAMAMAHECAHHQRGDLLANMIALAVMALHWCNPIAWIAWWSYRADQELACDARVLAHHGRDKAHAYGRAILKAAGGRPFAAACHLTRLDTLKGRLKMLSNHADSLHRISWGMAAVALITLAGLALTASGSRAAREMATITDQMDNVNMARLANLVAQPASANKPMQQQWAPEPAAPSEPAAMAAPAERMAPAAPAAPTAPMAPTADMVAPIPPVPPVPPVTVRSQSDRITITHANGRVETHRIPTQADIARMVPVVDVRDGCDGNGKTTRQESVSADGRRMIHVRICQADMERVKADRAARAADRASAQADWMSQKADRASAQADRESRLADMESARAERTANAAALKGLRTARAQIANNTSMPAYARTQALREIDGEIANMRDGND